MPSVVELSEITEKNRGAVESLGVWRPRSGSSRAWPSH
jgi:hypothetical protein